MMRMRSVTLAVLAATFAAGQQSGSAQRPAPGQAAASSSEAPAKKAKPARQPAALMAENYSEEVATALLSRIADGLIRRNPKVLLSAFDAQHFSDYGTFADRVRARMSQHDSFRVHYRIVNTTIEGAGGAVAVELQIEESFALNAIPPTRTTGQARFTFERGANGWRIVEVAPRDLITGDRGSFQSSR
jgi:hypothetical protein